MINVRNLPEIKTVETTEILREYLRITEQIERLSRIRDEIKKKLKEQGIGTNEPFKTEVDGKIVKISLKKVLRETLDKKKAKELLPEQLYNAIRKVTEYEQYEIRVVKK